jgi:hypothetical protein
VKGGVLVAKKKIKAKAVTNDTKTGKDNESLMHNYGLSAEGILQAMNRLIWEPLMSPSELSEWESVAGTVNTPISRCVFGGDIQLTRSDKCPH